MDYGFKLDQSALDLVLAGLGKLPYEISAGLISQMQAEAQRQREAPPNQESPA